MLVLIVFAGQGCKNSQESSSDIPTESRITVTNESEPFCDVSETLEATIESVLTSETCEPSKEETTIVSTVTSRTSESTSRTTTLNATETSLVTEVSSTTVTTTAETEYIPDSAHYLAIATRVAESYGCSVVNSSNWDFYRNPIHLDSTLSDSVFERYVNEIMSELVANGNGYRVTFNVWVNDERTSGNQIHGPGFYLYIG